MANPSVPGFQVDFPADQFRNAITFAMQMGLPTLPDGSQDPDKRPIFVPKSTGKKYYMGGTEIPKPRVDRDGRPLDPTITVVDDQAEPIRDVNCAVEITEVGANEVPVGNFRPTKATVTVLDIEYPKVANCREMIYNGDRFLYDYEPENNGLFSVGVHTLIFFALGDT